MVKSVDKTEFQDWGKYVGKSDANQYGNRIKLLKEEGFDTKSIKQAVDKTIQNLGKRSSRSFVIFGEPQSGKTEMMIALNMRLLDEGEKVIVNLLTDSVDLLEQSLQRFRISGMNPSPKKFDEILKKHIDLIDKRWVIFAKKNAQDLRKLTRLLHQHDKLIVIDDEADYASPNARVNREGRTKINELIHQLLGDRGKYIGVTATPARLNLNNTFENNSDLWVYFKPHPNYVGQDFFFPSDGAVNYRIHTFNHHQKDERKLLREAVMHFLCGVTRLHQKGQKENYTMLVHTSGRRDDHDNDVEILQTTIDILSTQSHQRFNETAEVLAKIAKGYTKTKVTDMMKFILGNIGKHAIVKINSSSSGGNAATIANPTSLFSFGVGGNIISRGVTFDNLLSLYFTRSVKGKFSQDTYVQRARMFGSRNNYKEEFQLWIPISLLENWSKCFEYHKLALESRRKGTAPIWLADHKTIPTAPGSIDRSTVDFEGGEMSFQIFDYNSDVHGTAMERGNRSNRKMLENLTNLFSDGEFPPYLYDYLVANEDAGISFHKPSLFGEKAQYDEKEIHNIQRKKGVFSTNEYTRSENPNACHHLKIFYNTEGKARIFYKINGKGIKFIRNLR